MTEHRRDNLLRFFGLMFGLVATIAVVQLATAGPAPIENDLGIVSGDPASPPSDLIADKVAEHQPPTLADRALRTGLSLFQGALGGIVIYGVGKGFAVLRRRKGWLRRGLVGDVSATATSVLITVGGALAIGATWDGAMLALGTVIVGGGLLANDPDTVKRAPIPAAIVVAGGEPPPPPAGDADPT